MDGSPPPVASLLRRFTDRFGGILIVFALVAALGVWTAIWGMPRERSARPPSVPGEVQEVYRTEIEPALTLAVNVFRSSGLGVEEGFPPEARDLAGGGADFNGIPLPYRAFSGSIPVAVVQPILDEIAASWRSAGYEVGAGTCQVTARRETRRAQAWVEVTNCDRPDEEPILEIRSWIWDE